MSDKIDSFHVMGVDGVVRTLNEHYDNQKDVEQDPYGAWLAIQNQAVRIEELEAAFANISREYDERGGRIEELDAKLAKAVEAMEEARDEMRDGYDTSALLIVEAALAELKGGDG